MRTADAEMDGVEFESVPLPPQPKKATPAAQPGAAAAAAAAAAAVASVETVSILSSDEDEDEDEEAEMARAIAMSLEPTPAKQQQAAAEPERPTGSRGEIATDEVEIEDSSDDEAEMARALAMSLEQPQPQQHSQPKPAEHQQAQKPTQLRQQQNAPKRQTKATSAESAAPDRSSVSIDDDDDLELEDDDDENDDDLDLDSEMDGVEFESVPLPPQPQKATLAAHGDDESVPDQAEAVTLQGLPSSSSSHNVETVGPGGGFLPGSSDSEDDAAPTEQSDVVDPAPLEADPQTTDWSAEDATRDDKYVEPELPQRVEATKSQGDDGMADEGESRDIVEQVDEQQIAETAGTEKQPDASLHQAQGNQEDPQQAELPQLQHLQQPQPQAQAPQSAAAAAAVSADSARSDSASSSPNDPSLSDAATAAIGAFGAAAAGGSDTLNAYSADLDAEADKLHAAQRRQLRDADGGIDAQMLDETKDLLELFGVQNKTDLAAFF